MTHAGKSHDHHQFDAQLQAARQELAVRPDEGLDVAAGLPSLAGFWSFLAGALTDPQVRALLWELWQKVHPTPQPAPPPESV